PMFTCGFERSNFSFAMVVGALSVGGPSWPDCCSARRLLSLDGKIKPNLAHACPRAARAA
ncbi:hypothetical protein, partial [Roseovarius tolerans]|uniref:hypothetical protein n=1 Tax=Roseovarius tolerans TaxID=74031 RepID=UPI001F265E84